MPHPSSRDKHFTCPPLHSQRQTHKPIPPEHESLQTMPYPLFKNTDHSNKVFPSPHHSTPRYRCHNDEAEC